MGECLVPVPDQFDSHAAMVRRFEALFQRLEGLGTARDHLTQFRYSVAYPHILWGVIHPLDTLLEACTTLNHFRE